MDIGAMAAILHATAVPTAAGVWCKPRRVEWRLGGYESIWAEKRAQTKQGGASSGVDAISLERRKGDKERASQWEKHAGEGVMIEQLAW